MTNELSILFLIRDEGQAYLRNYCRRWFTIQVCLCHAFDHDPCWLHEAERLEDLHRHGDLYPDVALHTEDQFAIAFDLLVECFNLQEDVSVGPLLCFMTCKLTIKLELV